MKLPQQFETVSLNELNIKAPLLNREDRKFVFHAGRLQEILQDCVATYYLLKINDNTLFNYRNWYFDTAHLDFYHQHHCGKTTRCKIRKRLYVNSGQSFIEVKQKTNKGNTVKHRTACNNLDEARGFIQQYSGYDTSCLQETIEINYNRITLLHKHKPEKVTLDLDLFYRQDEAVSKYDNLVIAEVKTEKCNTPSFSNIMKLHGIREGSLSKYCLGLISSREQIKYNNFKQQYYQILKTNQHGILFQP